PVGAFVEHFGPIGGAAGYGIVVQTDSGADGDGYYVACFDRSATPGQPRSAPEIHYLPAASLKRVESDPRRPIWERGGTASITQKVLRSRTTWVLAAVVKIGITVALVAALVIQHSAC